MMGGARLMCRFPAGESRGRFWSPEEASSGAVPLQEAKCARLVKWRMSPSSRAAPEGPMPCSSSSRLPVPAIRSVSSCLAILGFLSMTVSGSAPTRAGSGSYRPRPRGRTVAGWVAALLPRQVLLGADEFEQ